MYSRSGTYLLSHFGCTKIRYGTSAVHITENIVLEHPHFRNQSVLGLFERGQLFPVFGRKLAFETVFGAQFVQLPWQGRHQNFAIIFVGSLKECNDCPESNFTFLKSSYFESFREDSPVLAGS